MQEISNRKIVIINQTVNYLTVDICNAFAKKFETVALITGYVHEQERKLDPNIEITYISKWVASPFKKKFISYLKASHSIFWLLKFKYKNYEVFFVSVPPMGYLINLLVSNRFSMLIWDVFPDAFKVVGMKEGNIIYRVWAKLNKWSFNKSFRFYTIGNKMADLLSKYVDRKKIIITPIWSVFTENNNIEKSNNIFIKEHGLKDKFIVQYSGNIALAHKVEHVVRMAELLIDQKHIFFQIIGRGTRVEHLKKLVKDKNLNNCQFLPFQSNEMFRYSLSAADLGVVILDDLASVGSVPSKSYNLMSYGIPSLYITSKNGELYQYTLKYKHGECFTEDEIPKAANFIKEFSLDIEKQKKYKQNSLNASKDFTMANADVIVDYYLK